MAEPSRALSDLSDRAQKVSDIYAARFGINRDALWHLCKMTEELGEVHAAYLNTTGRGRARAGGGDNLGDELADLLAFVLLFARSQEINLDEALDRKWFCHLSDTSNSVAP